MAMQAYSSNDYLLACKLEAEARQKQLLEDQQKERDRIRWLEFRNAIETHGLPIIDLFLTVLGRLWFGYRQQLKGPEFKKRLVDSPAYRIFHEVYGPMAVFEVVSDAWEEREVPFLENEIKAELIQQGYRCRVVTNDDGTCQFQDDDHNTLILFDNVGQITSESLVSVFTNAFVKGPSMIHARWKNVGIITPSLWE